MQSLQYTGRPFSGLKGTVVSFLQNEQITGNFSTLLLPAGALSSPSDIPLQLLISLSTTSLERQYNSREDLITSSSTSLLPPFTIGGRVLAEKGREVTPSIINFI